MLGEENCRRSPGSRRFLQLSDENVAFVIFWCRYAGKAVSVLSQNGWQVQGFIENKRNKCFVTIDGIYVPLCIQD